MSTAMVMVKQHTEFTYPTFSKKIITIVGGYGSGKSEVAVNLAYYLRSTQPTRIAIADLDIVNPYFRSREAADRLKQQDIHSIVPTGSFAFADLPIILPSIRAAIEKPEGTLILDVGGDDVGARVLSSLMDAFPIDGYEMLLVLNANRPFTSDIAGCRKMINEIEMSSRLKFTGIIANSHMMEHTTPEIILDGVHLAEEVGKATNLPIVFTAVERVHLDKISPAHIKSTVLPLDRYLLKPWERSGDTSSPKPPLEE